MNYTCKQKFKQGPNMLANLVKKALKFSHLICCNHDHNRDRIWMQSKFPRGLNMLAIENLPKCNSSKNQGRFSRLHIWSVSKKIASIYYIFVKL